MPQNLNINTGLPPINVIIDRIVKVSVGMPPLTIQTILVGDHTHDDRYYRKAEIDQKFEDFSPDITPLELEVLGHINDTNNPHNVTKSQLGLGNVNNTNDASKPISVATQNALDLKASLTDLSTAISGLIGSAPTDANTLKKLNDKILGIQTLLSSDNINLDSVQELVDAIETIQVSLSAILVDDIVTGGVSKALTAQQGVVLKGLIDTISSALDGKADLSHSHTLSDVAGLIEALEGKSGNGHVHAMSDITDLLDTISGINNAISEKQDTITLGTAEDYLRGDLSLGVFPTLLSQFSNDSGYLVSPPSDGKYYVQYNGSWYELPSGGGGAGINYRGVWDYSTNYSTNDIVYYSDGNSYISIGDSNMYNTPYEGSSYWGMIARKGDAGANGIDGGAGPQGDKGDKGDKGDTGGDSYSYYYDMAIYIDGTYQSTYESIYFYTSAGTSSGNTIYLGNGGGGGGAGNWLGDYNYYASYSVGDIVFYDGSSWHCTSANSYNTPYEGSSYWGLVARKGNDGSPGIQGDKGDKGDTGGDSYTYYNDNNYYYDMNVYVDGTLQGTYTDIYFHTSSGTTSGNNIYLGNGGSGGGSKNYINSLYDDGSNVYLDGDSDTPGANSFYGVDESGVKGWFSGMALRWKGEYYDYTTYYPNDVVSYQGEIYICLSGNYGGYHPDDYTSYWVGGGNTNHYSGDLIDQSSNVMHFKNGRLLSIN